MEEGIAPCWYQRFIETLQQHPSAPALKDAALQQQLGKWTELLTAVVVAACQSSAWAAAARGHRSSLLPVSRQEYLSLDVVAFEQVGDRRWRFPVAIFELENGRADDAVAHSLWKVLCVRAALRVVFCYRPDTAQGSRLVRQLSDEVARAMEVQDRAALSGQTLLIVGSRNDAATFPYGFFKDWLFDTNSARFARI
jgi:hypothetical protein